MGYKKAFSLLTIQLMLPLSTLTKEEYKATYGIDLNDIDFEKVSLLQKEGSKEKYYVDEIKVTEDGVDIYAGGKILSIGESSVSVTENAYSVDNAKPLYYHPISVLGKNSATMKGISLSLVIINNSSEPINSIDKFLSYLRTNNITYISPCSGSIYGSIAGKRLIVAWIDITNTNLNFRGHYVDDDDTAYLRSINIADADLISNVSVDDSPNKIN